MYEYIFIGLVMLLLVHVILSNVVRGGWEGVLIYQGQWVDAILDDSSTAAQTTFYFPQWPVTDSGYVVTDDETDVILYDDGGVVASGDWTLDGSAGSCVFDVAPVADSVISATFYFKETVGYWQNITFEATNNVEKVKVGGSREVLELKEHEIEYSFKCGNVYIDMRSLWLAMGSTRVTTALPSLTAFVQTAASGGDQMELQSLKFDKSKLQMATGKCHGVDVEGYCVSVSRSST